jgi:hypothetical protein
MDEQQLAIVGQLPALASRKAPERLVRLALHGLASPPAAVRDAAYWRVKNIAESDAARGAFILGAA